MTSKEMRHVTNVAKGNNWAFPLNLDDAKFLMKVEAWSGKDTIEFNDLAISAKDVTELRNQGYKVDFVDNFIRVRW